ncbi:hypothetical protein PAHAL_9G272600 [Panicum hallii]|jgi:hypothetical protein|uniref:Uncharacterized protein n=1 Tax=Panicum hallii TaxID=206008 RepID=A0A2T8I2Q8_9POAL|nr:hypothetical protein PAHAL_9G272600 [Panicum hallii]
MCLAARESHARVLFLLLRLTAALGVVPQHVNMVREQDNFCREHFNPGQIQEDGA